MKHKILLFTLTLLTISFVSAQTIGIVGPAANGWPDPATNPSPDIMLTDNGDGTHTIQSLQLSTGDAKFRTGQDWALDDYGGTTFPTGNVLVNTPNSDIPVTFGNYDVTLDLIANTYTFTSVGPTSAAPTPTEDPADVVSIYSDAYTDLAIANYDPNWGQSGHTQVNTTFDPTGAGADVVLAYPNFNYQGTDFGSFEDLSDMDFLHVDIWVPAGTNRQVKVSPINGGPTGTGVPEVLVEVPLTPGSWNSVALPKADFTGMTWDSVFQLKFDGQFNGDGSANTTPFDIYVDNIYFSKTPAVTGTIVAGPFNVAEGSPVTVNINDAANSAGFSPLLYDSFEITADWVSNVNAWSSEADLEAVIAAGSTVIDPPTSGQAGSSAPATLTFSGDFAGIYDPSTDGTFDIILNQSFGGSSADWSNIQVTLFEAPTCITPVNLAVSNVTTSTADLTWDAEPTATAGYDYVFYTVGSPPDENTTPNGSVGAGVTTANLTGLLAASSYDAYVRSNCGGGDVSEWTAVVSFETPCVTFTAPFSEDFNADPTSIPICWSQGAGNAEDWLFDDAANIPTSHIGDNGSFPNPSPSAGGFAWVDDSTPHSQDTRLESPMIDVSGLTVPALTFYFISDNEDSGVNSDFRVEVWDGAAWNEVFFSDQNSANADWQEVFVDLSTLTITGDIQLAFIVDEDDTGNFFDDDVAIDDVSVDEAPTCIKPTSLSTTNVTADSADLSWVGSSTETNGYDYVLITDGSTPDGTTTPTGTVGTGVTTANLTGLTSNTTYVAYVRTKCAGEDSDWSSATSFTTLCLAFTAPYSENFDSVSTPGIPSCWSVAGNSASEIETDDSHFGLDDAPSAPNFVKFGDVDLLDGDEAILVSPQFSDIGSYDKRIRFKAAFEDGDANSHNFYVGVMSDPTDATTFVELEVVTSTLDETFSEFTVNLDDSGLIGSSQYVAIAAGSVAGFDELGIDDFIYEEIPSCVVPTNLAVSNVTTTTADLTWDAEATATDGYDYVLITDGSTPDGTTTPTGSVGAGVTTAILSGLSPATPYDAYVRSNCGGGDLSAWTAVVSFATPCNPEAFPYFEDFESGSIDLCWSVSDPSEVTVESNCGTNATSFLQINGGTHTTETNAIDVSGETAIEVTFDISNGCGDNSEAGEFLDVEYWDGAAWQLLESIDPSTIPNDWTTTKSYNVSAGLTADFKVRFDRDAGTSGFDDLDIDNFSVDTPPACIVPTNLAVSNVTTTTADLSWDAEATATGGYDYVLITDGSTPDGTTTPTGSVGAGVTTANLSGLTAGTAYDAYVRSDCSGSSSAWSAVVSFSTNCDTFNTFPFSETFDSANATLNCWSTSTSVGARDWEFGEDTNAAGSINGNDMAFFDDDEAGFGNDNVATLLSPVFDLTAMTNPQLLFDYHLRTISSGESLDVEVWDGAAWQNVLTYTNDDGAWTGSGSQLATINVSSFSNADFQVRFIYDDGPGANFAWYAGIDNFTIEEAPACPAPLNLTASNVTVDSADLAWDEESLAVDGYEYVLITDGSTPDGTTTPTGSVADATTLSVNLTGLTPETTYDAYVRSVCDAAAPDVSDWSTAASFTTLAVPPANDNLCDAIPLTVDATSTSDAYTNSGATAQTDEPVPGCFNNGIDGSVWFTFVAPSSGSVEVTTDIPGGVLDDTELAVFEAPTDCNDLTTLGAELDCNQDIDFSNFLSTVNLAGLTPGDTYYVQVDQWGTATAGTFGIEVREKAASVQIIHNSADPAAQFVDIYLNGNLVFDDFEFRTATPFVSVPADVAIDIDVAPSTSADVSESIFNLNTTLADGESYIAVANGVIDPTQFDASVNTIDFGIDVFTGAQQVSTNPGETSLLVHHGSTDAPTVDVRETSIPVGIVVDDISYSEFQGYLDLINDDYVVDVELGDNSAVVASYEANLQSLNLADAAVTVLASGFLDPAANQNGPAFGLWAALPAGGPLVELPEAEATPMTAAPDPTEDPADVISMYSGVYTDVPVDTWLTSWSSAQLADIQIQGNDTKLYTDLDFAGIETVANPIDASSMGSFHIDVWSPNATTFRVKLVDLGNGAVEGEIAFSIAQEQWVSLEIPLDDFADPAIVTDPNNLLTVRNSIQQVIISGLPVGAVTAYVDNVYFSTNNFVSTKQFDSNNFTFYPNPAQNILNLQTTNQVDKVKVYNMLGQEVMSETPNTVSPSLNVEALQVGTYIMNVTIDGSSANFRFIKE